MFVAVACAPACQNNGICSSGLCLCPNGYEGSSCEIRKWIQKNIFFIFSLSFFSVALSLFGFESVYLNYCIV